SRAPEPAAALARFATGMKDRRDLAKERTDWAEDRTLLANERTFAGWIRTGLTAIGVGLGFHALFRMTDPDWAAKAVATVFIVIGVFMVWRAYRASRKLLARMEAHEAAPPARASLRAIALSLTAGAAGLCV